MASVCINFAQISVLFKTPVLAAFRMVASISQFLALFDDDPSQKQDATATRIERLLVRMKLLRFKLAKRSALEISKICQPYAR